MIRCRACNHIGEPVNATLLYQCARCSVVFTDPHGWSMLVYGELSVRVVKVVDECSTAEAIATLEKRTAREGFPFTHMIAYNIVMSQAAEVPPEELEKRLDDVNAIFRKGEL